MKSFARDVEEVVAVTEMKTVVKREVRLEMPVEEAIVLQRTIQHGIENMRNIAIEEWNFLLAANEALKSAIRGDEVE